MTIPTETALLMTISGKSYAEKLVHLSDRFAHMNRHEHDLEAIQEAVYLYRQLVVDDPDTFNAALASSLNNLCKCLSNLGHRERALQAINEAVDLHRQCTVNRPDSFNAHLAESLNL